MGKQLSGLLAPGGIHINYGRLSGKPLTLTPEQAAANRVNLQFFVIAEWMNKVGAEKRQQVFNELWNLFAEKELEIPVAAVYPLAEFRQAIKAAEDPGTRGKVLLKS